MGIAFEGKTHFFAIEWLVLFCLRLRLRMENIVRLRNAYSRVQNKRAGTFIDFQVFFQSACSYFAQCLLVVLPT